MKPPTSFFANPKSIKVAIAIIIFGATSIAFFIMLLFGVIQEHLAGGFCTYQVGISFILDSFGKDDIAGALKEMCAERSANKEEGMGQRNIGSGAVEGRGEGIDNLFYEVSGEQCFPVVQNSLNFVNYNFGNRRETCVEKDASGNCMDSEYLRCHAGVDILTKAPGHVVAVADGVVSNMYSFYGCKNGWGGAGEVWAIIIDHGDYTINYGEIDADKIAKSIVKGSTVKAGQVLGVASRCGMLHLELYENDVAENERWYPPEGASPIPATPKNYCRDNYMSTIPPDLADPTSSNPTSFSGLGNLENYICSEQISNEGETVS